MRLSPEEALVLVADWPEKLSGPERLTLLRQLTTLDLPKQDIERWQKEIAS